MPALLLLLCRRPLLPARFPPPVRPVAVLPVVPVGLARLVAAVRLALPVGLARLAVAVRLVVPVGLARLVAAVRLVELVRVAVPVELARPVVQGERVGLVLRWPVLHRLRGARPSVRRSWMLRVPPAAPRLESSTPLAPRSPVPWARRSRTRQPMQARAVRPAAAVYPVAVKVPVGQEVQVPTVV